MRSALAFLVCSCCLSACSTQSWYEGMQAGQQVNCEQAPNADAQERCRQRSNEKSYEEYQRERESLKPPPRP